MRYLIGRYEDRLVRVAESRALRNPLEIYEERIQDIDELRERMKTALMRSVETAETAFVRNAEKLNLLSPLTILSRGYAICWKLPENSIVRSAAELAANDRIRVRLHNGALTGVVENTEKTEQGRE
jgi:exodeoxyribonuclease VII large subunit